jgi:uncharacterized protein with PIN domain
MLGTLAKWLRILGYDTYFDPDLDDHQLVRIARAEDRVLLTRDTELARRRGVQVLLLSSESLEEQLHEVLVDARSRLGSDADRFARLMDEQILTRCPVCNEPLEDLDRDEARARVPPYVFQTQEAFKICPGCQRVYWRGTHWERMQARLSRILSGKGASSGDEVPETH